MEQADTRVRIGVDQLRVGLYVSLDLKWSEHPFLTNSFKIKDAGQIDLIRRLGLRNVLYFPAKSDCEPAPPTRQAAPPPTPTIDAAEQAAMAAKKARLERLREHREAVRHCERELQSATDTVRGIEQNLFAQPRESLQRAQGLVSRMLDSMLVERDVAIHALSDTAIGEELYHHAVNVAVLAMMLAKAARLSRPEISLVGLGCLFHDIGKSKIPDRVLRKSADLNPAERSFLAQHPLYGEEIGEMMGLSQMPLDIIRHHHEHVDGSGYPDSLKGDALSLPVKIAATVNAYDILCNHHDPAKSVTPFEAISSMFARQRHRYDAHVLGLFIHMLGVYPPGTVVQLSNQLWGLVVSVNANRPVKPNVLVYDPEIPKEEAVILDLEENPDLGIERTCRPSELPRAAFDYLRPQRKATYYTQETRPGPPAAGP